MRRIIAFLVLGHFIAFGQNGGSLNNQQDKSYIPNITPPTPESFNMTKYGDVNVNEFYGKTTFSIPILTYTSGQLQISLTLSHDGSGVKVDDVSNWTGSNWSLDTGGIITRTINDLTDETAITRKYISNLNSFVSQYNTIDGSQGAAQLNNFIQNNTVDSEVDIFNFSVPGYSGSFYLDENYIPRLTKIENELKIETIGVFTQSNKFVITTPNGVKYYFGGINATESTSIRLNPLGSGITSYFLYQIEHPVSGNIFYEYINVIGSRINLSTQQSLTFFEKVLVDDMSAEDLTSPETILDYCPQNFGVETNNLVTSLNQLKILNHKYLRRIYSDKNSEEIFFNSENFENNLNLDRKLNSIEMKEDNQLIKKINFLYYHQLNLNKVNRIFLTNLQIDKDLQLTNLNQKKFEEYIFKYNAPETLPARLSYGQDFLGYFNGKTNYSLLPNSIPTSDFDELPPVEQSQFSTMLTDSRLGNRTPVFEKAIKGILTDVIYPTGGYTHFEYEPEPAKRKKYKIYSSDLNGNSIPGYNFSGDYVSFTPVYATQLAQIYFSLVSDNFENNHFCQASLKITDLTDSNIPVKIFTKSLGYSSNIVSYEYNFIQNHTYSIEIIPSTNAYCNIEANFWIKLFDGYEKIDNIGIRLKKQTDFSCENDSFPTIKRYYYSSPDKINIPVEELPFVKIPNYFYDQIVNKLFDFEPCSSEFGAAMFFLGYYETQAFFKVLTSNSFNNYFSNFNGSQVYPNVTISYGGDNFENGGIYKKFFESQNFSPSYLFPMTERRISIGQTKNDFESRRTNHNIMSGDLIEETLFNNNNSSLYKISKTNYNYEINIINSVSNLVGKQVYSYSINAVPTDTTLSNLYIALYDVKTFSKKLISKSSNEYMDIVPLLTEDEAPYKKITTTQTYEYGTLKGLPTAITSSTSEDTTVNKTVNTYVNTASTLPNIPSAQAALYTSLLAQNRVGEPVQVQQFQNTALLSTQRTLYKNWLIGEYSKILPEKIQLSKGVQPLEDKALFYNYDTNFNPAVIGYAAAPKTKYIFNTDGLVVAKIENYIGTATTFPVITGNIDNTNCALQTQNPTASVTVFTYDLITKKLLKITDSRCQNTFYVYDTLQRLQFIKDHDGNIVKEFDQQFKPQN